MLLDPIPDVVPLTSAEKVRLGEFEAAIERHLDAFLQVGKALGEIRNRRLYRVEFVSFESYLKTRWGLAVARANELISSYGCAELLLGSTGAPDSPTPLPERVPEAVMRSIAKVPGNELRSETWRLIATMNRQSKTSLRSTAHQVSHAIRATLLEAQEKENEPSEDASSRVVLKPPKMIFTGSVLQLARSQSFDPQLAVLHLKSESEASTLYKACRLIATRCAMVETLLLTRYPQLQCLPEPIDA